MSAKFKPWLCGGLAAAVVLGVGTLAVGTLVRAQQEGDAPVPATTLRPSEAPPGEPAHLPKTVPGAATPVAPTDADTDAGGVADASSAPEKPAPVKPAVPLKRPRYQVAILQALDKVTAETERFEAPINTPVRYKTLIFTVRACETTAADESIVDAAAHVEVVSQPKAPEGGTAPPPRQIFKGWMFANSPGLNLLQHPVYDAWLIACKTEAPSA